MMLGPDLGLGQCQVIGFGMKDLGMALPPKTLVLYIVAGVDMVIN